MLVLLLLTAASGCYTLSLMQDPKPLSPGAVRGSVGMAVNPERAWPSQHLGLRVGLIPHVEARAKLVVGGKYFFQSAQAGFNLEVPLATDKSVSFMPYYRFDSFVFEDNDAVFDSEYPHHDVHALAVPILFVEDLGRDHLFLGPDVHAGMRDARPFLGVGFHLGYAIAAGRYAHITPELSLLAVVAGTAGPSPSWTQGPQTTLLPGDVIAELGLSCSFGDAE
jgi:hypothetical protein